MVYQSVDKNFGSAVITALLAVMFTAALITYISWQQHRSLIRTEEILNNEQAYQHALGVEKWAIGNLKDKLKHTDNVLTDTSFPIQFNRMPIPGGYISGAIKDMQSRFNIKGLADPNVQQGFKNMIQQIIPDLNDEQLTQLITNLQAFLSIENNSNNSNNNGDNSTVQPTTTTTVVSSTTDTGFSDPMFKLTSISELRLLPGITSDIFLKLSPYITSIPTDAEININTMDPILLYALQPTITQNVIENFVQQREEQGGFKSLSDFPISQRNSTNVNNNDTSTAQNTNSVVNQNSADQSTDQTVTGTTSTQNGNPFKLSISSRYYLSEADVMIGKTHIKLYSLLEVINSNGTMSALVLWRSRGAL